MIPPSLGTLKAVLERTLPTQAWASLRAVARWGTGLAPGRSRKRPSGNVYEALYEAQSRLSSDEELVGGRFDLIGRIELGLLLVEGLRPTDTVVDFGCGTGRLAIRLIPVLDGGHYIGIEISQPILDRARQKIGRAMPEPRCRVTWVKQTKPIFPLDDRSVDLICAFSVFTHMEHEDTYAYLVDARRVIRPGGRLIFSCLPMNLRAAHRVFLESARQEFRERWSRVRDVTTSVDLMETIARLAGWTPLRWYPGDRANIRLPDTGELVGLGQSTCVLEAGPPPLPEAELEEALGRIVLTWESEEVALGPRFSGPLPDRPGHFVLAPDPGGRRRGSLTAPPFAALDVDAERRTATVTVNRLVSGVYRYAVVVEQSRSDPGDALSRSGATVTVISSAAAEPRVFRVPAGGGASWTVFEVIVAGDAVTLEAVDARAPWEEAG